MKKNEMQGENKISNGIDRRSFCRQTLAGGVVLATGTVASGQDLAAYRENFIEDDVCDSRLSFIDSLSLVSKDLSEIKAEILRKYIKVLGGKLKSSQNKFLKLKEMVDELEDEIRTSGQKLQSQNANEVVELGKASFKILQNTNSETDVEPYFMLASTINKQIVNKAESCLPENGITLSPKATLILKNIIKFIKEEAIKIQQEMADSKKDYSEIGNRVYKDIKVVEDELESANDSLMIGENPQTSDQEARVAMSEAYVKLGKAIQSLRSLVAKYDKVDSRISENVFTSLPLENAELNESTMQGVFDKENEGELIDVTTISLEVIRQRLDAEYSLVSRGKETDSVKFVKTNFNSRSKDRAVARVLWRNCPSGTPYRVAEIKRIIGASYLTTRISGWVHFVQVSLIRNRLKRGRNRCRDNSAINRLADELARIF